MSIKQLKLLLDLLNTFQTAYGIDCYKTIYRVIELLKDQIKGEVTNESI